MASLHSIIGRVPQPVRKALADQVFPQMIPEGETAPEWQLQSYDGSWHRLKAEWSVMVFYPGDDTPGCTKQLEAFQEHYARLQELGCQVYAVNPAEEDSHRDFAEKYGFDFPILTDRGAAVSRRFRTTLPIPFKVQILRSVYLINPERKIRLANRGSPSVAAITRSIEALQQATKSGM